jgi:exonuclease III
MKTAAFHVNGINGRLPVRIRWLAETRSDVACLQELKAPQAGFTEAAIRQAGDSTNDFAIPSSLTAHAIEQTRTSNGRRRSQK